MSYDRCLRPIRPGRSQAWAPVHIAAGRQELQEFRQVGGAEQAVPLQPIPGPVPELAETETSQSWLGGGLRLAATLGDIAAVRAKRVFVTTWLALKLPGAKAIPGLIRPLLAQIPRRVCVPTT